MHVILRQFEACVFVRTVSAIMRYRCERRSALWKLLAVQEGASKEKRSLASKRTADSGNTILGQMKLEDLDQERLEVRKSVEKKSTTKKPSEKKTVSAAKAAADTKAEVKAAAVEEQETEAAEVKAEEPKTEESAAKKEEAKPKATRAKTVKKEETAPAAKKEETEPKTKAKAAVKVEPSEKIVLQIGGREDMVMANLIERVKAAYVAEGHKADSIKNIEVYIKMDENMAYYVIDGYASGINLY